MEEEDILGDGKESQAVAQVLKHLGDRDLGQVLGNVPNLNRTLAPAPAPAPAHRVEVAAPLVAAVLILTSHSVSINFNCDVEKIGLKKLN